MRIVFTCRAASLGTTRSASAAVPAEELPSSPPKIRNGWPFTTSCPVPFSILMCGSSAAWRARVAIQKPALLRKMAREPIFTDPHLGDDRNQHREWSSRKIGGRRSANVVGRLVVEGRHRSLIHAASQKPSVDGQHVARDKTRGLGGQEHRSTDQFLDLAKTAHRCSHQGLLPARRAVEQCAVQVRAKYSGGDGIYADAMFRPFDGQSLRQGYDRRFAGAISGDFVKSRERCQRGNVDDASVAALDHQAPENLAGVKRSVQVGLHHPVPVALSDLERGHFHGNPGTIYKDVDGIKLLRHPVAELFQAGAIRDVASGRKGATPEVANFGGGTLDQVRTSSRGNDVGAGFGKSSDQGQPDARRSSNDDRSSRRQIES